MASSLILSTGLHQSPYWKKCKTVGKFEEAASYMCSCGPEYSEYLELARFSAAFWPKSAPFCKSLRKILAQLTFSFVELIHIVCSICVFFSQYLFSWFVPFWMYNWLLIFSESILIINRQSSELHNCSPIQQTAINTGNFRWVLNLKGQYHYGDQRLQSHPSLDLPKK